MIDVNKNDKKLKKNGLIDVHAVTLAYLEQKIKPTYRVIVNQSIGENIGIYPDLNIGIYPDISHELACSETQKRANCCCLVVAVRSLKIEA